MPFFIIVFFQRGASAMYLTGGDDWGHGGGCGRVISNLRRLRIRAHSNATGTSRERNFRSKLRLVSRRGGGGRPRGRPRYEPISGNCSPLSISTTRSPQIRLCRTTVRPGLLSTFATHTEPSETEIFLGLQALCQVARQERRLRSVLHSRLTRDRARESRRRFVPSPARGSELLPA
jgi:hypothetical protein